MRVYLDKQIISHLFKQNKSEYIQLLEKIYKSKDHIIYCYSQAHLLDLQNDKTDIKYDELRFLETIVQDNFISHDPSTKITSCYLAKPLEAFEDIKQETEDNFASIFDIDEKSLSKQEKQKFIEVKNLVFKYTYDTSFFKTAEIPTEYQDLFNKLFPSIKNEMSTIEIFESLYKAFFLIQKDRKVYKSLRDLVDSSHNKNTFSINYEDIEYGDKKRSLILKKEFIDFVKNTLEEDKKSSKYDFFSTAYFSLDLLGISKEPSKTVKFNNMLNDALHSYYGAYCDIVVSDDEGFLKKTKALYKLLDIDTQILSINDFIKMFSFSIDNAEKSLNTFASLLTNDLKNGLIINTKKSVRFNRNTNTIKPNHNYLGFFNRIDNSIEDGIRYLYFYKELRNYSNFTFFREFESIINNAVKLFGNDSKMRGNFDWDKETKEISNRKWEGRYWKFNTLSILIEKNSGTKEIGMLLNFDNDQ